MHHPDEAHNAHHLAAKLRDAALALGFVRVGFARVEPFARGARALDSWLKEGHNGEMAYMAAHPGRASPASLLDEARSLVVVALPYAKERPSGHDDAPPHGLVARYAQGADYHTVLGRKLRQLAEEAAALAGRPVLARPCVDSAPLLEREAAARAGVGFIAKSTMCIVPGVGSYVLLGELLLDVELTYDAPAKSRCGSCQACLSACPTGAFVDAFVLDARRCISYLTIELRGPIPRELRSKVGTWVFGCDICQQVCPFNASPKPRPAAAELTARPALTLPVLTELLHLGAAGYRKLVRGTALSRVSRWQLARNAAVALGNARDPSTLPALLAALCTNSSPLVRGHVAWALGRIGGSDAVAALSRACSDVDPFVREEAQAALEELALAETGRDG